MDMETKPIFTAAVLYTTAGSYPSGVTIDLSAAHAADLVASGHVTVKPPANLPEVADKTTKTDRPKPPKNTDIPGDGDPALD